MSERVSTTTQVLDALSRLLEVCEEAWPNRNAVLHARRVYDAAQPGGEVREVSLGKVMLGVARGEIPSGPLPPKIAAGLDRFLTRITREGIDKARAEQDRMAACHWPTNKRFSIADEPGEHDPCYLVCPDGAMIELKHHAQNGVDQARAQWIADACNAALTPPPASQPAKQGEGESAEWCAEAKLTLGRLYRFLDAIKAPHAVDTREWIENAEKMLATNPAQATIKEGAAQAVAGDVGPLPPVGPDVCPFTGRKFWGNIEHPELGVVATYGGPFDTYTLPQRDADDPSYYVYRFDQDAGAWVDGVEDIGVALVDDQLYTSTEDPAALTAEIARLREPVVVTDAMVMRAIKARNSYLETTSSGDAMHAMRLAIDTAIRASRGGGGL